MNENDPYWWLHEEPEKWWKRMELGEEMEIPHYMGTATTSSGTTTDLETMKKIAKLLSKAGKKKPSKRKREPAYRFLKQKDIDKLMDKHFNENNSSNRTQTT